MRFGERMRARREELGISRAELAAMMGISGSAVGNYEGGVSFPKEEVLLRLFDCLETDPNTLFQDSFRGGALVLDRTERQLLEQYRGLSARGRESVRSVVGTLGEQSGGGGAPGDSALPLSRGGRLRRAGIRGGFRLSGGCGGCASGGGVCRAYSGRLHDALY